MEINGTRSAICFRFVIFVLLLSTVSMLLDARTEEGNQGNSNQGIFLLLIVDLNDFMCPACLDSLLDFCGALPLTHRKRYLRGMVVIDKYRKKESGDTSERVLEKKIKGFIKGNHIDFPVFHDRDRLFEPLARDGTAVFIFIPDTKTVSRHVFHLTLREIGLIRSLLEKNV